MSLTPTYKYRPAVARLSKAPGHSIHQRQSSSKLGSTSDGSHPINEIWHYESSTFSYILSANIRKNKFYKIEPFHFGLAGQLYTIAPSRSLSLLVDVAMDLTFRFCRRGQCYSHSRAESAVAFQPGSSRSWWFHISHHHCHHNRFLYLRQEKMATDIPGSKTRSNLAGMLHIQRLLHNE